ncbi:MAG TPA: response regulator [Phenylobacterium sp.]|nr:response regulator [Phenylobacterium sp.]
MASPLFGMRLLLVEDEAMVAMMLEAMLTDLGCVVVDVAGTVSRGLSLVETAHGDLDAAVLDVNLGGEKVYPVAERLAADGVPFVFSTGYGVGGIAPGFDRIPALAKPFGAKALENALLAALGRSGSDAAPGKPV